MVFLAGLALISPWCAQIQPDQAVVCNLDGDNLADTADDPDPLPPQQAIAAIPSVGRAGLTASYRDAWTQGPTQPPATPPPIVS